MKWRSKKTLFWGLGTLVVAVVAVVFFSGSDDDGTAVTVDVAFRDEISEVVSASGRVQPQTKVDITSQVSAQIIRIFVKDGDYVEHGQPLLLLDTVQLMSDVTQAEFTLEELTARSDAARSTYERDRLEYERQQKLREQNLAPAEIVYRREGLEQAAHKLETPLASGAQYFWTVRARFDLDGRKRVTSWGSTQYSARETWTAPSRHSYRFRTP